MGLEIDRRLEVKGVDEEIFRSSERRYTRASLLALSETEVCKRLSPVGFDAVSLDLSRLEVGETVDSWEELADSPVNSSNGRDSDSLSEPIERPNSGSGTSGRTESCSVLGPIERPNSSRGILPPVATSGRTESHSLLGPFEPPDSRDGILPLPSGRTQSHSLLGPIERPKRPILLPASSCGNGLLPPPSSTLQIPPGFCSLSESPSPCLHPESKPQNADAPHLKAEVLDQSLETGISLLSRSANPYRPPHCDHLCCSCLPEAPQLKAEVLDQSLETGVSLLSKSANPYRPPHCREAQAQLDTKVESDGECSPKLQIGEMEIQSVNLEAKEYRNLVSSSGLTASDGCFGSKVDCLRHCKVPFVDASTLSIDTGIIASRTNQTGIIFGDLEEFVCLTKLHDMKADELDFEDVWSEVSAKMRLEQEMELKRGAGSDDEKGLPEDNCDDHSSADFDAPICWPDEDSLISIDDMLKLDISALKDDMPTLDISTLKDDKENNSVKEEEDTSKPKPKAKAKQEGARKGIREDIARFKRKSGPVLPQPLLLPHQIFHIYRSPSSGATTLIPPLPPLSAGATAPISPPPRPSSGGATAPVPPPPRPLSGVATAPIPPPPRPLGGGATAPIRSPPRPLSGGITAPIRSPPRPLSGCATRPIPPQIRPRGTGTFFIPAPLPWGYRPAYIAPVYTHIYQVSSNLGG